MDSCSAGVVSGGVVNAATLRARLCIVLAAVLAVSACSSAMSWDQTPKDVYVVKSGDTLYGIAWRHGLDHRELARWNNLGSGTLIRPGQTIRLSATARTSRAAPPRTNPPSTRTGNTPKRAPVAAPIQQAPPPWVWPVGGRIVAEFGSPEGNGVGALLAGKQDEPVHAAASGKVVYAGSGLIGYGQLIIIKHNESFLSAYGHNSKLLVKEGEQITKGQAIARMGVGPERKPRLHFEIRQNGNPVNPRRFMPQR
ncbi:MAG: peptidoglycan DD-metalloendopeptidase family protein [Pseudomonadota bacterium]